MGANGAGKSTLVKILTGAVRPDGGTIVLRGKERAVHSPAEARKTGMVSVYQEPAIIPDLTIAENLVLTETPLEAFRARVDELGLRRLDLARPGARPATRDAAGHRPGPGTRHRARRAAARRDDRGLAGRPDRERPRGRGPPARDVTLGDLHLAPHARGRRPLRPRHGAARGKHGRRRRHRARAPVPRRRSSRSCSARPRHRGGRRATDGDGHPGHR